MAISHDSKLNLRYLELGGGCQLAASESVLTFMGGKCGN